MATPWPAQMEIFEAWVEDKHPGAANLPVPSALGAFGAARKIILPGATEVTVEEAWRYSVSLPHGGFPDQDCTMSRPS